MTEAAVELDGVVKRYAGGDRSVTAIDGLSARIEHGRITGMVGPDGAGKTTLMRLIAGLLAPQEGEIRVLGMDSVRQAQQIQAAIGYMPQRFGLYEDLSVAENLALYADLQGVTGAARRARIDRLMAFTGLDPFRKRLAGRLSGGMKQKLGLACALVRAPRLLLLDEPSVGVDPVSRRELWSIVEALVDEGVSVLWSTAYLDEAERCADVLLLSEGKLLRAGAPGPMSEALAGRTFALPAEGVDKRTVVPRLRRLPQVMDALVRGSELHLLFAERPDEDLMREIAHGIVPAGAAPKPVPPRFEDVFIALLREQQGAPEPAPAPARPHPGSAAPAPGEAVIRVEHLVRSFGRFRAVDDISFEVGRGEIFGLLGPNGAGKSTTFKMLCGLLPSSAGEALVLGIDLRRAAATARSHIGYMAQKFSLYGNMSVLQNLQFFASAYGLGRRRRTTRIGEVLGEFGLGGLAGTISAELPLGYKQRLALACAIMHEPAILFLDEPTSGVDPIVRRTFWTRINAMAAAGVTVLVTTHFMEEAEYCDRIGIIYRGKLIALGSPDALRAGATTAERPTPSLEDAFVDLIERHDAEDAA